MATFTIYPKDGDAEFKAEFDGFEIQEGRIVLLNYLRKESNRAYLATDAIAAIVPPQNLDKVSVDLESVESLFLIYLKGRNEPIKILAATFEMSDVNTVLFYQVADTGIGTKRQSSPMQNIYVAKLEVVAIFPSTGLARKWRIE